MGGCTANSDMDMDTTCSKKTDSAKDTCPSDTHHCHPDHAKAIQSGANKGCTANSDMDQVCFPKIEDLGKAQQYTSDLVISGSVSLQFLDPDTVVVNYDLSGIESAC